MDFQVVYTKPFNGYLRSLQQQGYKKIVQAVRAAISEAGMNGEITLPRTKHGESRIPNAEKYDLPDAFRLVVQLVDGVAKVRAFLFVGTHDDAQHWLDTHRNYKWVKSKTDGTLEFVQVTEGKENRHVPADRMDLESPEDLLALPLLRVLEPTEWSRIQLDEFTQRYVASISGMDYERDADGILVRLDELAGYEKASLVFDLLLHAHAREWSEVRRRISVLSGDSFLAPATEVAEAMLAPDNSETFVTFDDDDEIGQFFSNHTLADWMLFLHPEQKKIAEKDYRGPARLRGVSGSGKTCVLVHRARYLAKKYRQPVLLVTLTESMRKLLEKLVDDLCGVERNLITALTMSAVAKQVVHELHPQSSSFYSVISPDRLDRVVSSVAAHLRAHPEAAQTSLPSLDEAALDSFLRDEIAYVRSRLRTSEQDHYTDARMFQRRGRGIPLNEASRRVVLDCIRFYEAQLATSHLLDHEGIVAEALELVDVSNHGFNRFRGVLCDEVQDLSQLEVALLGKLSTPSAEFVANAENGLFLAGDGAQTIYKRGFVLRRLGIDISGRSVSLRKNYRNTHEILTAAFGLVDKYEFADVDEESVARPSAPEFAKRRGARPLILRCSSPRDEAVAVARAVKSLIAMGQTPGQICVVGPSVRMREEVQRALNELEVRFANLQHDVDYESDRVKISTIESAKGHEFGSVFIMGLVEGVLPNTGTTEEEIPREAARLYVAMTRAREALTITYSAWTGYPASRFLMAIQGDCDEAQFRDGEVRLLQS